MATAALPPGLIDTDILIDAERGLADAVSFLSSQHSLGGIQLSAISAMELIVGCRNQLELSNVLKSLANSVVHELSSSISHQARAFVAQFSLSHGLQLPDALIGATAIDLGLTLYTKNVRHFHILPGITILRPY